MTKKVSRRRPAPSSKKKSTALAVVKRKPAPPAKKPTALAFRSKSAAVKAAKLIKDAVARNVLTDDGDMATYGLSELKLTDKEELVLAEPVPYDRLLVKPDGAVYLSHPEYTRWLNRAFGRTGWSLVPAQKPQRTDNLVMQTYLLYVHGVPVAHAAGEQEYQPGNRNQSWGDALESTVASALRRCAKRLGIGLELWDKGYVSDFLDRECVAVWTKDREGNRKRAPEWRRKTDKPFYNEIGAAGREQSPQMTQEHKDANRGFTMSPERGEMPITDRAPVQGGDGKVGQVQRLWIITKNSRREPEEVKVWLKRRYGYDSSKTIKQKHYDEICKAIQAPGPLQGDDGRVREPGEDD